MESEKKPAANGNLPENRGDDPKGIRNGLSGIYF